MGEQSGEREKAPPPVVSTDAFGPRFNDVPSPDAFGPRFNEVPNTVPSTDRVTDANTGTSGPVNPLFDEGYPSRADTRVATLPPGTTPSDAPQVYVDGELVKGPVRIEHADKVTIVYGGRDTVDPNVAQMENYGNRFDANYPQLSRGDGRIGNGSFYNDEASFHRGQPNIMMAGRGEFGEQGFRPPAQFGHYGHHQPHFPIFGDQNGPQVSVGFGNRGLNLNIGGLFNIGGNQGYDNYGNQSGVNVAAAFDFFNNRGSSSNYSYRPTANEGNYHHTQSADRTAYLRQQFQERYREHHRHV